MEKPLETVIDLQRAYDELGESQARLAGIPDWMSELHEEHSGRREEIEELEAAIEEAADERRASETEAIDLKEKLRTYQDQISRVRNQREYGALLQEIDGAKGQIKALEERAFEAMQSQEETRKSLEEQREGFRDLDERYAAELEKWEAEKPEVAAQVKSLEARIEALREKLSRPFLDQFDRIFERYDGHALAEVSKTPRIGRGPEIWACGNCNYSVRPQAVVEILNHGRIVLCDSCKRILFIAEAAD